VSIDYSLLLVTRWREELAHGQGGDEAVHAAMATGGRAIVFSGLTVAVGLLALVLVPVPVLRSMGYGGMFIPLVGVLVTLTLLPVLLASVGRRLDWPRLRREAHASRGWTAWAQAVVRHRWLSAVGALGVLAALWVAALGIQIGEPAATSLAGSTASSSPAIDGLRALQRAGIPTGVLTPILPLKAVLLNLASVGATYGVLVLVWQHGHGSELIWNIPATGAITNWVPLITFAFLYGLSMDYEVFILVRMREAHDRTGSTTTAITEGIGRTGRLVTSAALILFLAFASLGAGPETDIKVAATGLGAGILLDATIVRALLVPALVSPFGRWNWWLPAWAARACCGSHRRGPATNPSLNPISLRRRFEATGPSPPSLDNQQPATPDTDNHADNKEKPHVTGPVSQASTPADSAGAGAELTPAGSTVLHPLLGVHIPAGLAGWAARRCLAIRAALT
jgi:uncharacterized membrane protein YdfJ with MMPL/SSD domain